MGLDMYLNKKHYVGNKYREPQHQVTVSVPVNQPEVAFPVGKIVTERISEITEEVGYWRKANEIHQWFVNRVQDGIDDCKEYYVQRNDLETLLSLVSQVLDNRDLASDLLPTQEGFFFGGTEYDEYYFQDLEDTKHMLESVLAEHKGSGSFYYQSSW